MENDWKEFNPAKTFRDDDEAQNESISIVDMQTKMTEIKKIDTIIELLASGHFSIDKLHKLNISIEFLNLIKLSMLNDTK